MAFHRSVVHSPDRLLLFGYFERERDRERAQARGTKSGKTGPKEDLTPEQRRERDAKALQEKQAKKAAQAAGGGDSKKSSSTKK